MLTRYRLTEIVQGIAIGGPDLKNPGAVEWCLGADVTALERQLYEATTPVRSSRDSSFTPEEAQQMYLLLIELTRATTDTERTIIAEKAANMLWHYPWR